MSDVEYTRGNIERKNNIFLLAETKTNERRRKKKTTTEKYNKIGASFIELAGYLTIYFVYNAYTGSEFALVNVSCDFDEFEPCRK